MILPILDIGTPGAECEALGLFCFKNGQLLACPRKTNDERAGSADVGWNVMTTMKGNPNDEGMLDRT